MDARELRARLKAFAIRVRPLTGHHEDTKIHEGHDLSSLFLPFEKRVRALRASSCLREEPSRGRQPESRVKYVQKLPPTIDAQEIGRQLIRAGTGVSANYHAAGRSRS